MRAQILLEFNVAPRSKRNRGAIENQHGALLQTDDPRRRLNASWRVLFARSCCTRARVSGARALSSSEQHHRARAALRGAGQSAEATWRITKRMPEPWTTPASSMAPCEVAARTAMAVAACCSHARRHHGGHPPTPPPSIRTAARGHRKPPRARANVKGGEIVSVLAS